MNKRIEVTICETFTNGSNMTPGDQVNRILKLWHIVTALLNHGIAGKLNMQITLAAACRIYWISERPCEEDTISSKMQRGLEL